MRPDNKKPRSGQQRGKDGHLLGANNGHCSQFQYRGGYRDNQPFNVDAYMKKAQRAIGDCFVTLKGWPSCIRYSYFVGPDGKLITRAERRAVA